MKKIKTTIIKPPVLYSETQKIIKEIEKKSGIKLLCYWNSINGSVCQNDVIAFYEIIKDWNTKKDIYLFIKSDGGDGKASLRIINLLRQHSRKLIAIIQGECASAATMLALGADEIHMGPVAFLTAIDTSLTHDLSPIDKTNSSVSVSQDELTRVIRMWDKFKTNNNPYPDLYEHIHPLVFGAVDRASSLSIKLCTDILSFHMKNKKKAAEISKKLNSDFPSHSYPIMFNEAKNLGLNIKELDKELNNLLFDLNNLYSEMGRRAYTDYDENNYHDNETRNIIEANNIQIYYQVDKDWHYRNEERRYIPMNDNSAWYKISGSPGKAEPKVFQIR
ncbi:MAG: ATP-dependent Clp protease proteolytic subunit [Chitinophagaceae bacterium]|nr:ATP-dependent Clp protease proteolytic subunit [Chitinophagaceae bacterium]